MKRRSFSLSGRVGCDLDPMLEEAEIEAPAILGKHRGFDYRVYTRLDSVLTESRAGCHPHALARWLRSRLPSMLLMNAFAMWHTVHNLAETPGLTRARLIQRYAAYSRSEADSVAGRSGRQA